MPLQHVKLGQSVHIYRLNPDPFKFNGKQGSVITVYPPTRYIEVQLDETSERVIVTLDDVDTL